MRHLFFLALLGLLALPLLATASVACSSSSSNNAIIGEWRRSTDADTEIYFFDTDGTCGLANSVTSTGKPQCIGGTYTFDGTNLDVTWNNSTETATATVSFSGSTMTIAFTGAGMQEVCTQVNDDTSNTCP
jgi:hypothetical protein